MQFDSRLMPFLEPPIRRLNSNRELSRQAFEEMYRLFEDQISDKEKQLYCDRVLFPHGIIAQEMTGSDVPSCQMSKSEAVDWIKNMRSMATFSLSTWINNVWSVDKVIALYPPQEICSVIHCDWWRNYKTDYIMANFKPWMAYLSLHGLRDSSGNQDLYEGMYVAFDYFEGEVRLALLHMTKRGTFDPFYFHEFSFKSGMTLGEVVDGYRYSSPYRNYVEFAHWHERRGEVSKGEFEALMQVSGQVMASRLFPLLLGLVGGELQTEIHSLDTSSFVYESELGDLPDRNQTIDPISAVDAGQNRSAKLCFVKQHQREKDSLN